LDVTVPEAGVYNGPIVVEKDWLGLTVPSPS